MDQDNRTTQTDESQSFADLLDQSFIKPERLEPGKKIKGKVIQISTDWIFLDLGRKDEGYLAKKELLDQDGNLKVSMGDIIEAYFLSSGEGGLLFTTKIGAGAAGEASLEEAYQSGIPVEGYVEKEIKGGYEVRVGGGFRGFCPFSLMGLHREDGREAAGKHLPFKVMEFSAKGRRLILSNRAILEEEASQKRESLKETLKEGMILDGTIKSIQDYGAFVDVGGIEGLIPISEIGWGRLEIRDTLTVGQQVQVTITKLDWEKNRHSFSMKDALPDPWDDIAQKYPEGSVHPGRVARVAQFGAFVTLAPGIDGLIHISVLARGRRLKHAREALQEGQEIEVKVEKVDRAQKRLSLSMLEAKSEEDQETQENTNYADFLTKGSKSMGTLGEVLAAKMAKKKN